MKQQQRMSIKKKKKESPFPKVRRAFLRVDQGRTVFKPKSECFNRKVWRKTKGKDASKKALF